MALLPGVRDDQALRCIQRLKQQVNREFSNASQGYSVELTAGISFYPKNGVNVFGLLQSAQESMRSALGEERRRSADRLRIYRVPGTRHREVEPIFAPLSGQIRDVKTFQREAPEGASGRIRAPGRDPIARQD